MRWPDIFFKAKPARTEKERPLPAPDEPAANAWRRLPVSHIALPPDPVHPVASDTTVVKEMSEADTLRQMTRSGGIRLVKRDFPSVPGEPESIEPAAPATASNEYPSATPIPTRRTTIAGVARIIPPPPQPSAVVPPSFPVSVETGSVLKSEAAREESTPSANEPEKKTGDGSSPESPKSDTTLAGVPVVQEKREFVLSNGERLLGRILSETPESIYLDHDTLGVLTIPRAQIAQRPVEIILVNGDRIVGDIIAETSDSLFVRHASLGILTVPRNQRSTRVVEAILKDGDRILGEVLGETENFTVIRSASLGTVTVPHNQVALLNRRAEQMQIKTLPPATPQLKNKPET